MAFKHLTVLTFIFNSVASISKRYAQGMVLYALAKSMKQQYKVSLHTQVNSVIDYKIRLLSSMRQCAQNPDQYAICFVLLSLSSQFMITLLKRRPKKCIKQVLQQISHSTVSPFLWSSIKIIVFNYLGYIVSTQASNSVCTQSQSALFLQSGKYSIRIATSTAVLFDFIWFASCVIYLVVKGECGVQLMHCCSSGSKHYNTAPQKNFIKYAQNKVRESSDLIKSFFKMPKTIYNYCTSYPLDTTTSYFLFFGRFSNTSWQHPLSKHQIHLIFRGYVCDFLQHYTLHCTTVTI